MKKLGKFETEMSKMRTPLLLVSRRENENDLILPRTIPRGAYDSPAPSGSVIPKGVVPYGGTLKGTICCIVLTGSASERPVLEASFSRPFHPDALPHTAEHQDDKATENNLYVLSFFHLSYLNSNPSR